MPLDAPALTFVIACAPYHEAIVERAVQSALQQSIACNVIVVYDGERRGAGWARNRGVDQVTTPFTVFLDADDELDPQYAEKVLRHYDGKRFVYTDWYAGEYVTASDCPGAFHPRARTTQPSTIVTILLPTSWLRYLGGFDETLPGGEDTELIAHLTREGLCGKHLAEALVYYRPDGQRGKQFILGDSGRFGGGKDFDAVMRLITERYGGKPMACCGQNELIDVPIQGEQQSGDVLVATLWQGSRKERGRVTGRLYEGGWGAQTWVDPRDAAASEHLFRVMVDMPSLLDDDDFAALAAFARQGMNAPRRPNTPAPLQVVPKPANAKADMGRVLELYRQNS